MCLCTHAVIDISFEDVYKSYVTGETMNCNIVAQHAYHMRQLSRGGTSGFPILEKTSCKIPTNPEKIYEGLGVSWLTTYASVPDEMLEECVPLNKELWMYNNTLDYLA